MEKVDELRKAFFAEHPDDASLGSYDKRDIERIRSDDAYVACFVRSSDGDLTKAVNMLDTVLKFRMENQLNDLTKESFPPQFEEQHFLYWQGKTKENHEILHFSVARHQKGKLVKETKSFIAYYFNQYQTAHPGVRIVLIFDFTGAGVTNMDLDVVRYIISCLTTYFPSILGYILLYEMPWLLSSIWKLIRSWLNEEQKKRIFLVKKTEIQKYIDESELEPHMRG